MSRRSIWTLATAVTGANAGARDRRIATFGGGMQMADLDHYRPAWTRTEHGAFCPCCGEHIADGSEDYDWGCGCCGYPDAQAVADYRAGYDQYFPEDDYDA
jgi:hypothetical protein